MMRDFYPGGHIRAEQTPLQTLIGVPDDGLDCRDNLHEPLNGTFFVADDLIVFQYTCQLEMMHINKLY